MYFYITSSSQDLYHHGVKGQKWGVRRYQNKDGSLTSKGKKHYSESESINYRSYRKEKKAIRNQLLKDTYGNKKVGDAQKDAADIVAKKLLKQKYGDEKISKFEKTDTYLTGAALTASILAASGISAWVELKLND